MGVVDRVHGDAAVMRTAAQPALAPGVADRDVHVIGVRHRADGGAAATVHQALLARVQTQDDVVLVAAAELGIGTGGARELAALADLDLDIVDDGADRHVAERHDIAGLHVDMAARDDGVAAREPLRREDIGLLAVLILDQGNKAGAIRIVFQPLDGRRYVDLLALEIDQGQRLLVAAATETHGYAAGVVAAAGRQLAFGQGLDRLALVEGGAID